MKTLLLWLAVLSGIVAHAQKKIIVKNINDDSAQYANIIRPPLIFFNQDNSGLGFPSHPMDSIKVIADFIKKHPTWTFEIGTHADYRWDERYSTMLHLNRSKTIVDTLIKHFGIDPWRVSPKGYGKSNPRILEKAVTTPSGKIIPEGTCLTENWIKKNFPEKKNKDDFEFVMQMNRRTEIKILRTDFIPQVIFTLKGKVTDNETKEPIAGATVKLVGSDNTSLEIKTDSAGNYFFDWAKINPNTAYVVSASALDVKNKKTFRPYLGNPKAKISTAGKSASCEFIQDFTLKQVLICYFGIPYVTFLKNSSVLDSAGKDSIDYILKIMNENPNITIEIASHSSYEESNAQMLSFERAKAVVEYLIKQKGIDPERITPLGYGKSKPFVLSRDYTFPSGKIVPYGTTLSQEWITKNISKTKEPKDYEYAVHLNRRVTFSILRRDYVKGAVENPHHSDIVRTPERDTEWDAKPNSSFHVPVILFDKNSAVIKQNYKDSLDKFFEEMPTDVRIIEPHGSYSYDESPEIAEKRVKNISAYLFKKGIKPDSNIVTHKVRATKKTKGTAVTDRNVTFLLFGEDGMPIK